MVPNGLLLFSGRARCLIEINWRLKIAVYALARGERRVDALPSTLGSFGVVSCRETAATINRVIVQYFGVYVHKYVSQVKRKVKEGKEGKKTRLNRKERREW